MSERAAVLVHGATGFTGKLVCAALARKKSPFAISGRNKSKLEALAKSLEGVSGAPVEIAVVDIRDGDTMRAALAGRKVVSACAG
ncbi:MAG: NAD(P)H-binding protein, partial [Polyangiaceae bacterium]